VEIGLGVQFQMGTVCQRRLQKPKNQHPVQTR
jgi:hypothetical protein